MLALHALNSRFGPITEGVRRRAHTHLRAHLDVDHFAELWFGQGLYTLATVVRSAVLFAWHITALRATAMAGLRPP
ncbi:hypothetical protein [Streptomyces chartreusis]|uniref:hypothetical protein n=1 Tax=Streptomyces chartreusis TaxID=1969 RepID=UPI002E171AD3